MRPENSSPEDKCPVDPKTREKWLETAKARKSATQPLPTPPSTSSPQPRPAAGRFSLDTLSWLPSSTHPQPPPRSPAPPRPKMYRLSTDREISSIPRAIAPDHTPNSAEQAALPKATASHGSPANAQGDTGFDQESGNWIYPSQSQFFAAMRRKGHEAEASDMSTIIPIHNAVNEKAWAEIKAWEAPYSQVCGGPKLVSFAGDSKALTPRARWKSLVGYQTPFDRHDWVVDRCGKRVEYVIDFYSGKGGGVGDKGLNFFLDVRPKLNSWEGVTTRAWRAVGW
ncbi:Cytochrome c1 heme lyase [Elasticomyces elasticus]|nr:Cytochrome c1 heme lyase [Elasticomyces elasticus]